MVDIAMGMHYLSEKGYVHRVSDHDITCQFSYIVAVQTAYYMYFTVQLLVVQNFDKIVLPISQR